MKTYILNGGGPSGKTPGTGDIGTSPPARSAGGPPGGVYPDTRRQRLGGEEIKRLGMMSALAWRAEERRRKERGEVAEGTVKARQDAWRHAEVRRATEGRAGGLRELMRDDYQAVAGHFLFIADLTLEAFNAQLKAQRTRHGDTGANAAQAAQAVRRVCGAMESHMGRQVLAQHPEWTPAQVREEAARRFERYFAKTESGKCGGKPWTECDVTKQWNLFYTLKNRLADMAGTGAAGNRNKGQREMPRRDRAARREPERRESPQPQAELFTNNQPREKVFTV